MRKLLLILLAIPLVLVVLSGAAVFAGLQMAAYRVPESTFTRDGIRKILARESVVYYADGRSKVGTFFEGTHRDYVPYDSIPRPLVDALVSAEDRNYWKHGGMDFMAFGQAMLGNVTSGGRWRGGSTLTQQTAKNLFGRSGPLRGKIDELINAYRLEKHFSKQEILEFYLNQFFVVGNGHGVAIASRYFFDKDLRDLTLLECAFIAGSVKGPNQYNPFIQTTPERRDAALKRGQYRVAYVLKQMRRQEKISEADYRAALSQKLQFHRGDFRFNLSTNMVKVKQLLDSPEMQKILADYGVEDYTDAGLQIYTTLDPDAQRAAEYAVYTNLWQQDLLLRGYQPPRDSGVEILSHLEPGEFHTGRVEEAIFRDGTPVALRVRFGAVEGTVPQAALETFFRQWNRNRNGSGALPSSADMAGFARKYLKRGSAVFCAVPYRTPDEVAAGKPGNTDLELAQPPRLQGAAQIVREGRVLANVGGFGNTGYDRVNQARRQFGSAFKPLVYAAALELGWTPLDPLPNFRQAFQIGGLIYFPKPDHAPEDTVSLAWAGRRSENIASVYLLYHLFDKADSDRFWEVCREIGLDPGNFASEDLFETFTRDSLGVVMDGDHLRELRFQKAVQDFSIDLTFEDRGGEAERLRGLAYGIGFERERRAYAAATGDPENALRARILERNYLDLAQAAEDWRANNAASPAYAARSERDGRLGVFRSPPPTREWRLVSARDARVAPEKSVFIEGEISLETLKRLDDRLRFAETNGSRYSRENLFASKDFRALAALRYVVQFSHKLGVTSKLDAVLSFPLGVNSISLEEAVNAYQVFQNGCHYATRFGQPQLYIEKIVAADGRTIFEDYAECEEAISPRSRYMLGSILASVVTGGTGQRIGRELRMPLGDAPNAPLVVVPAYGKTGTTNDYKNGAFLGYLAAPKGPGKGFEPAAGYAIGVYTGFDDNTPMQRMGFRGTGAAVAVPAWLGIAQSIVRLKKFSARMDTTDTEALALGQAPLFQRSQYKRYTVSRRTGLPLASARDSGYVEDLSDEIDPSAKAESVPGSANLWIREE